LAPWHRHRQAEGEAIASLKSALERGVVSQGHPDVRGQEVVRFCPGPGAPSLHRSAPDRVTASAGPDRTGSGAPGYVSAIVTSQ